MAAHPTDARGHSDGPAPVPVRFGAYVLDAVSRQLTRDGHPLHLTPKAFDLLALLVREAPRVVHKTELHDRLWPGSFVSDATLAGVVKELRRALDDRNPHAPLIRTAHRVGYAFCAGLEPAAPPRRPLALSHWVVVAGRRIVLREGDNAIGRDPASSVWLDSASVSRRHAQIIVSQAGVVLEDLGSKNGTQIGGQPVTGRVALQDGDRVQVGTISLVYRVSRAGLSTETQISRAPADATRRA